MRKLTEHCINPCNDTLDITVMDEQGAGGAHHHYAIECVTNPDVAIDIKFQNGPIGEVGVNGVTHEALLAILADRLRCFQAGPYACSANEQALLHVEAATQWLLSRTKERMNRGVEGTHEK